VSGILHRTIVDIYFAVALCYDCVGASGADDQSDYSATGGAYDGIEGKLSLGRGYGGEGVGSQSTPNCWDSRKDLN